MGETLTAKRPFTRIWGNPITASIGNVQLTNGPMDFGTDTDIKSYHKLPKILSLGNGNMV